MVSVSSRYCLAPRFTQLGGSPLRLVLLCLLTAGCNSLGPSNDRIWSADQAVLPTCDQSGDQMTVRNIRNLHYLNADEFVVDHYDKTFDLQDLESVDYVVCPFNVTSSLAHTMLSFGFAGGEYLGVSVEIRKEKGESFSPWKGSLQQYEIMYVVADERDLIQLRTNHRDEQVYLYPVKASPPQLRALFLDVMRRANKLAVEPEFYDTLTNNCTTNIARHVNKVAPGRIPFSWGVLLPGYSDRLAFNLGLLETPLPFEATRAAAHINDDAERWADSPIFSRKIRWARNTRLLDDTSR